MLHRLKPRWLELYLAPHALGWAELSGWPRRQLLAQGEIDFAGAWPGALGQALAQLPALPVRQLLLSDALLHYLVAPWPHGIGNRVELLQYAHSVFGELHGLAPEQVQLTLRGVAYRQPLFMCGLPRALLTDLQQAFSAADRRLPRITALFGSVFDQTRKALPGDGLLLLRERHSLSFGVLRGRRWQQIHSLPLAEHQPQLLAERLRQAAAAHGLDAEPPLHVAALVPGMRTALRAHGWRCSDLNPLLASRLAACGLSEGGLYARA